MGIKDLWPNLLDSIKKKDAVSFSTFKGKTVGIDISVWLHKYCHTDVVAMCMNSVPQYVPTELLAKLQSNHRLLVNEGITPVYVFDGFRHPMKKVARVERDMRKNEAKEWLDEFYADGRANRPIDENRRDQALRHLLNATNPDANIISMIVEWMVRDGIRFECALFEAEWQLVQLEKDNVIDALMTEDGDAVVLSGQTILFDVNFNKKEWKVCRQSDIVNGDSPLARYDPSVWPLILSAVGSDYHARVPNVGVARVFSALQNVNDDLTPEVVARELKKNYKTYWRQKSMNDEEYVESLSKSASLFRHAPVLNQDDAIVPLNPLKEGMSWGVSVGLGNECPSELLPNTVEDFSLARKFKGPTFETGAELPNFQNPVYSTKENPNVDPNTPLPRFARLDFDKIPIACCHSAMLQSFISARMGSAVPGTRDELVDHVERLIQLEKGILEPEKVPLQIAHWLVCEVLEPLPDSQWSHGDYFQVVKDKVESINASVIKRFYSKGNEHNRERATLLVKGGNVDYNSFEYRMCKSRTDDKQILLFRSLCTPSMLTEVASANETEDKAKNRGYILYLAFSVDDGRFLAYPFSCCGCYDGRGLCSHQLGNLCVFQLIQKEESQQLFEDAMPDPPCDSQNIPTLIESMGLSEIDSRRKAAKKR